MESLEVIIGKRIKGVVVKEGSQPPKKQIFLLFSDDTYYEIYGNFCKGASGLDRGGLESIRAFGRRPDTQTTFERVNESISQEVLAPAANPKKQNDERILDTTERALKSEVSISRFKTMVKKGLVVAVPITLLLMVFLSIRGRIDEVRSSTEVAFFWIGITSFFASIVMLLQEVCVTKEKRSEFLIENPESYRAAMIGITFFSIVLFGGFLLLLVIGHFCLE
jgi:hypothetical protein